MIELLFDTPALALLVALLSGWVLDLLLGDPAWLPHPVVLFGKMIARGERRLNRGRHRKLKGGVMAIGFVLLVFFATFFLLRLLTYLDATLFACHDNGGSKFFTFHSSLFTFHFSLFTLLVVFFCLAGTTLIREVRDVFLALDRSLDDGRRQVARIVGRDTSELSVQEVRTAALETLAENLSDGVIAPLFWYLLLGPAGMLTYKMVNTLDSMIGYRTERYRDFGCVAARMDDVFNYIPARLTALLMIIAPLPSSPEGEAYEASKVTTPSPRGGKGRGPLLSFVLRYGRNHASPNSGYPEAALAGILDCRFGGPHYYFGQLFDKPYIGTNPRPLTTADMKKALRVNRKAEVLMVVITAALFAVFI